MKKSILTFLIFISIPITGIAQNDWFKDLQTQLKAANHDTAKVLVMAQLSNYYKFRKLDSALVYGFEARSLARKINFPRGEVKAMQYIALTYYNLGNDSKGLQLCIQGMNMAEKNDMPVEIAFFKIVAGRIYLRSENFQEALKSFKVAKTIIESHSKHLEVYDQLLSENILMFMSNTFLEMNQLDSAMHYSQIAYHGAISRLNSKENWVIHQSLLGMGRIESRKNNPDQALTHFRNSLSYANNNKNYFDSYYFISQQFTKLSNPDSAIFYAETALKHALQSGFLKDIININFLISDIYESENPQKAIQFFKNAIAYNDSLDIIVNTTIQEAISEFEEKQRQLEIEATRREFRQRSQKNIFLGITFTFFIVVIFLFIISRREKKAKQKVELALDKLKATQSQLIHSEKMASLGELTAGIAHEIQNPLNFVNNFSEVNSELIEEAQEENEKKNSTEVQLILNDIKENESKISHHGKRAESIVKGMLLHSRGSSGKKEPTDINALCDEYVRLAYHGLKAKDKSFNADFKFEPDESLPKIEVVPEDIGRVLLNLINNAFYAIKAPPPPKGGIKETQSEYKPLVIVKTSYLPPSGGMRGAVNRGASISVIDNGPGIPEKIKDKIFQPFFTTKSAGEGTGLGLSLSYDIVKAHGGTISVQSIENEGTEFIISIPVQL